jgi:hypothetical protein
MYLLHFNPKYQKSVFTYAIKPQFDFGLLFFAAVIKLPFATSKNGRESCVILTVKDLLFYLRAAKATYLTSNTVNT